MYRSIYLSFSLSLSLSLSLQDPPNRGVGGTRALAHSINFNKPQRDLQLGAVLDDPVIQKLQLKNHGLDLDLAPKYSAATELTQTFEWKVISHHIHHNNA